VLMNQSPHTLDVICHLACQPSRVVAWNRTLYHEIETEDTSMAMLEWPNGALGMLFVSTAQAGEAERDRGHEDPDQPEESERHRRQCDGSGESDGDRNPPGQKADRRMKNRGEQMVFAAGTRQRGGTGRRRDEFGGIAGRGQDKARSGGSKDQRSAHPPPLEPGRDVRVSLAFRLGTRNRLHVNQEFQI